MANRLFIGVLLILVGLVAVAPGASAEGCIMELVCTGSPSQCDPVIVTVADTACVVNPTPACINSGWWTCRDETACFDNVWTCVPCLEDLEASDCAPDCSAIGWAVPWDRFCGGSGPDTVLRTYCDDNPFLIVGNSGEEYACLANPVPYPFG